MRISSALVATLCAGFTGAGVAWAEPTTADPEHPDYVEDGLAPHKTDGNEVRFGTMVGFLYNEHVDTTAMGITVAVGHRIGRLSLEAEADLFNLQSRQSTVDYTGNAERLALLGRFDILRLGPHVVGENSMLAFYVEGGPALAWNHWTHAIGGGDSSDADQVTAAPTSSTRVEADAGFGLLLEHRLQEPRGFKRIGWFLGWRVAYTGRDDMDSDPVCRTTTTCRVSSPMDTSHYANTSMLLQSSMTITW
ncbi:MAG TPA: hypothetical protein VGM88_01145 [Kofleriaceae bacterium]|jgi:hypothetical protein